MDQDGGWNGASNGADRVLDLAVGLGLGSYAGARRVPVHVDGHLSLGSPAGQSQNAKDTNHAPSEHRLTQWDPLDARKYTSKASMRKRIVRPQEISVPRCCPADPRGRVEVFGVLPHLMERCRGRLSS